MKSPLGRRMICALTGAFVSPPMKKFSHVRMRLPSSPSSRHSRLWPGTADIGTPTAQISRTASFGVGLMRPSMKHQNDENVALFVPRGKRQSPKSMRLFPKDDAAPWTCQFPTSAAFVGIS